MNTAERTALETLHAKLKTHDEKKPFRGTVEYSHWLSERINLLDELAKIIHAEARNCQ